MNDLKLKRKPMYEIYFFNSNDHRMNFVKFNDISTKVECMSMTALTKLTIGVFNKILFLCPKTDKWFSIL